MNNSKSNGNGEGEFFGAVSKNCKTVVVGRTKGEVKQEINRRNITKNNVVIFRCSPTGENRIARKPIHGPRFKLTHHHHVALTDACLNFLAQGGTG